MYSYQCVSQVSTAPRTACAQMCVVAWVLDRIRGRLSSLIGEGEETETKEENYGEGRQSQEGRGNPGKDKFETLFSKYLGLNPYLAQTQGLSFLT